MARGGFVADWETASEDERFSTFVSGIEAQNAAAGGIAGLEIVRSDSLSQDDPVSFLDISASRDRLRLEVWEGLFAASEHALLAEAVGLAILEVSEARAGAIARRLDYENALELPKDYWR